MIDVKIIRKPKNEGSSSAVTTGSTAYGEMAVKEAAHAARADTADLAKEATHAKKAGYADEAGHAQSAKTLDDGSVIFNKFIRKDKEDFTTFLLKLLGGLEVGEAVDSFLTGKGVVIDKNGRIQCSNIEVRGAMKVMRLIINEISAMAGDYSFTDAGTIEKVTANEDGTYTLKMEKRTDFDLTSFGKGDVVYSIVNNLLEGGTDYYTSWMQVNSVNTDSNELAVILYNGAQVPGGRNFAPKAGYNATRRGNVNAMDDPDGYAERGRAWLLSSREGRIMFLDNVVKPILETFNYGLVLGKLPKLSVLEDLPISEGDTGLYAKTVIAQDFYHLDYNFKVITNKVPRGEWSAAVASGDAPYRYITHEKPSDDSIGTVHTELEQHTAYHNGLLWGCMSDRTTDEPRWNNTAWKILEGDSSLRLEFVSTNGYSFYANNVDTIVRPVLYLGPVDITPDLAAANFRWSRKSKNEALDATWSNGHTGVKDLVLTINDLPAGWSRKNPVTFTCTVIVNDGDMDYTLANTVTI